MGSHPRDTDLGMFEGTCKFYSRDKGYGFLRLTDGREVFFHFSGLVKGQLVDDLKEDAEVSCRLWHQNADDARGNKLKATEVRITRLAPE